MRALALLLTLVACGGGETRPPRPRVDEEQLPAQPAVTAAASGAAPSAASGPPFQVDILDVGQGDAILLRSAGGKTALIDASTGNKGEDPLPALRELGVQRLDLVVATHPHSDHIGGMDEVLEAFPVKLYTDNGLPHTTDTYARVMRLVESKKIAYKAAKVGQTYTMDPGVKLTVLNPAGDPLSGTRSDLNANSVVIRATYGQTCFLFTGDSEEPTEQRLLENRVQPCDVLKLAHHGSGYSNTAAWLAAVQPQVALISAGEGNSYGHPDPEALDRVSQAGAKVFRTDQNGTIHLESDGRKVTITPARGAGATVTGRSTVEIPLSGAVTKGTGSAAAATPKDSSGGRLNLNTATAAELEALPGIGEKTAQAILADRKKNGPYRSVDELDRVSGIGPATIEGIRELVTAGR